MASANAGSDFTVTSFDRDDGSSTQIPLRPFITDVLGTPDSDFSTATATAEHFDLGDVSNDRVSYINSNAGIMVDLSVNTSI